MRSWAVLGAVLGDLGAVLGCLGAPWPLFSDLGAAGGDFESICDRFGLDFGSICIDLGSIWVDLLDFSNLFWRSRFDAK